MFVSKPPLRVELSIKMVVAWQTVTPMGMIAKTMDGGFMEFGSFVLKMSSRHERGDFPVNWLGGDLGAAIAVKQ